MHLAQQESILWIFCQVLYRVWVVYALDTATIQIEVLFVHTYYETTSAILAYVCLHITLASSSMCINGTWYVWYVPYLYISWFGAITIMLLDVHLMFDDPNSCISSMRKCLHFLGAIDDLGISKCLYERWNPVCHCSPLRVNVYYHGHESDVNSTQRSNVHLNIQLKI